MSTLHIELNVETDDLTGTAVDAGGKSWPINGWLSLIGIIDHVRDKQSGEPDDQTSGSAGTGIRT